MTEQKAMQIIREENLKNYNWFNDHDLLPNEVEITKNNDTWIVATADERINRISKMEYNSESVALDDFIDRLRADKVLDKYFK